MKKIYIPILIGLLLSLIVPCNIGSVVASPALADTNLMAVDPYSNSLFAYFNSGSRLLFKSDDSGYHWTATGLGTGLNGSSLVALEISPAYSDDATMLAATSTSLFESTDKGATFNRILTVPSQDVGGYITSLAIGPAGQILVGTSTGNIKGGVLLYDGKNWTNLLIGNKDVYAVAFSPNYADDSEILAFSCNAGTAWLETLIGNETWNSLFPAAVLYSGKDISFQSADLAFADDYDFLESNYVLVGINGSGGSPDLYRVHLGMETSVVTDLNLNGTGTSCSVHGIAITGTLSGCHVAAGQADSNIVKHTTGLLGNTISWRNSSKPPEGTANVGLAYKLADQPWIYAVTTGTGYGVFYSTDYGDTFNPLIKPENIISTVEDLQVSASTINSLSLAWTTPSNIVVERDQYDVRYLASTKITDNNWNTSLPADVDIWPQEPGAPQTLKVRGLQPQKTYYFAIKTGSDWVQSGLSNSPSGITLPARDINPPLDVQGLSVKGTGTNAITLTWTAPDDPDLSGYGWGGEYPTFPPDGSSNIPPFVHFKWLSGEGVSSFDFQLADSLTFGNLIDSQTGLGNANYNETVQLQYATTYCWRVRFNYVDGQHGAWVANVFTTAGVPTAHTTYDFRYSTQVINSNNWKDAAQCSGTPTPQKAGTVQTFTARNLKSSTTYYFAFKTRDEATNWSTMSNCASGKTKTPSEPPVGDHTPPGKIGDLKVIDIASNTATLQWTATGDDNYSGTASYYDIRYLDTNTLNDKTWNSAKEVAGEPSPKSSGTIEKFTVTGLLPEITYYFAIKAEDNSGNWSDISNIASAKTLDTTPPAAIADLAVADSSTSSVTIAWTATGDDGTEGTASQYDIRYTLADGKLDAGNKLYDTWKLVDKEPKPQKSGSKEKMVIGGLDSGASYYFVIGAADEVPNWSPMSGAVSGRTQTVLSPTPTPSPSPSPTPQPVPKSEETKKPSGSSIGGGGGIPTPQDIHRQEESAPPRSSGGAVFSVTGLMVSRDKVSTGETINVTATIANTGDQAGNYTAQFQVNGVIENTADVTSLAPGSNSQVQFEFKKDAAGSYNLQVGEKASTVKVEKPGRAWIWILIAFIVLLIILLILRQVLHWGFKKSKEE
jgi:chitodextrinase